VTLGKFKVETQVAFTYEIKEGLPVWVIPVVVVVGCLIIIGFFFHFFFFLPPF